MSGTKTPEELMGMSDEEFLKLNAVPEQTPETEEEKAARLAAEAEAAEAERLAAEAEAAAKAAEGGEGGEETPPEGGEQTPPEGETPLEKKEIPPTKVENQPEKVDPPADGGNLPDKKAGDSKQTPPAKPESKPGESETPFDYKAAYEDLMAPIQANGKTIELKSPQELKQLAQMGANYTKKMQSIAPHRKVLMMLENNGLMDEGKLAYLIDLDKKNPEAIKKLIKDAGINPMDIDTSEEPAYREGNHRVTDAEVSFTTQLDDLKSTPEGVKTIQTINNWDQASKEVLWSNPQLMATIHGQRANGIYDAIATEIDRRRTLGSLPAEMPFLHAYKQVGDELNAAGAFAKLTPPVNPQNPGSVKTPVATRTATPKPAVKNGDKAQAAAPSRSTPKVAKPFVNPLAMSDEEFMKEFNGRL